MTSVARDVKVTAQTSVFPLTTKPDRRDVRRWIRSTHSSRLDVHTLVDVLLVTTELIDNAYRHTTSPIELRIACTALGVLVEVADGDKDHPAEMAASDRAWGGRGVQAVVELAISWGVREEGSGKAVWALLPMVETRFTPRSG
ncbi:MAG TPA: ATP-binding protein [Umezawaea sp.]|nr:ATP-binding protein [Umezawaea sp.]